MVKKKCPKAETEGGRFCKICYPDVAQEDMDQLDRLGDCLQTLAQIQELMEEKTLEVTTDQLRSWALLCHHIAFWVPEKLAEAAGCQEGEESPRVKASEDWELDSITKGNLVKDVGKLAGMASELQLMAEGICRDLGLPLPEAIQEKIALQKAARGQGGAA